MKRLILMLSLFFIMLIALSCEKSEIQLQAVDKANLAEMLKEIQAQVDAVTCENSEGWSFIALGSKGCGGPQMYIAYPHSIDTDAFLKLVKNYTDAEGRYNEKHGIISDCMMVMPPSRVVCEGGKPVLVYDNAKVGTD